MYDNAIIVRILTERYDLGFETIIMAGKKLVNLDAMIKRADFAIEEGDSSSFEQIPTISVRDFGASGLLAPTLRKPDFQRETNHWTPEQVVSLLECYVNGDLIPSAILWRSSTRLFVIDGCHRLSVLRAWVEDDYGDGPISLTFFGHSLPTEQIKAAKQTRELIADCIGSWQHFQKKIGADNLSDTEKRRFNTVATRGLAIQWVQGNVEKAEQSFFKINTKGTPLDTLEDTLLRNRKKPIVIAARAVIRQGMGHKYWSQFNETIQSKIELLAKDIYDILFSPEINTPIKTLDLPLGGSIGVRNGMQILMEFILVANRSQDGTPKSVEFQEDDSDGNATLKCLQKTRTLAERITGNDNGSLGLHPAVYFYGPTGKYLSPMFMGVVTLIARKLANNDSNFFKKFTLVRARLEDTLVKNKELISTILQKTFSKERVKQFASLLDKTIIQLSEQQEAGLSEQMLINYAGLEGKVFVGEGIKSGNDFTDETKSAVFIHNALKSALKCPICGGYLDPSRSVSYDHIVRKREGGDASTDNCQLTHPYCNQSIKN